MPLIFLFIAEGIEQISDKIMRNSVINRVILLVILFIYPLLSAAYYLEHPRSRLVPDNIRQVVDYVVNNQKDGDLVYFRGITVEAVCSYYSQTYSLKNSGCGHYLQDLNQILVDSSTVIGKDRMWIIFPAHYREDVERDALSYLDSIGMKLDDFISNQGTSVYLYGQR